MLSSVDSESGACVFTHVPLSVFTDWKSGVVDVMALSKMGSFVRRGALQTGFSHVGTLLGTTTMNTTVNGASAPQPTQRRVFLASCLLQLGCSTMTGEVVKTMESVRAEVLGTGVGSSSYSLAAVMSFPAESGASETVVGRTQITYVNIDSSTRKPSPLDAVMKAAIQTIVNPNAMSRVGLGKMERLAMPPHVTNYNPAGNDSPDTLLHQASFVVRYSDTDFNGHVNQSVYIQFVVDACRELIETRLKEMRARSASASGSEESFFPNPKRETDLKELRIDYLQEVRSLGTRLIVTLHKDMVSTSQWWFTIHFQPTEEGGFTIAAQGYAHTQSAVPS